MPIVAVISHPLVDVSNTFCGYSQEKTSRKDKLSLNLFSRYTQTIAFKIQILTVIAPSGFTMKPVERMYKF